MLHDKLPPALPHSLSLSASAAAAQASGKEILASAGLIPATVPLLPGSGVGTPGGWLGEKGVLANWVQGIAVGREGHVKLRKNRLTKGSPPPEEKAFGCPVPAWSPWAWHFSAVSCRLLRTEGHPAFYAKRLQEAWRVLCSRPTYPSGEPSCCPWGAHQTAPCGPCPSPAGAPDTGMGRRRLDCISWLCPPLTQPHSYAKENKSNQDTGNHSSH